MFWRLEIVRVPYFSKTLYTLIESFSINTITYANLNLPPYPPHNFLIWSNLSDQYKAIRDTEGNKQVMIWKNQVTFYLAWGIGSIDRGEEGHILYTFAYSNSSQTLGCTSMTWRACFPFLYPSHTDCPRKSMWHNKFNCISGIGQYHVTWSNLIGKYGQGRELTMTKTLGE